MSRLVCSTCGVPFEEGAQACAVCGAAISTSSGAQAPEEEPMTTERRVGGTRDSLLGGPSGASILIRRSRTARASAPALARASAPAPAPASATAPAPAPASAPALAPAPASAPAPAPARISGLPDSIGLLSATAPDQSKRTNTGASHVHIKAAGFWHRLLAFLVDAAIVGAIAFVLNRAAIGPFSTDRIPALNLTWFDQIAEVILRHGKLLLPAVFANLTLAFLYSFLHLAILGRTPGKLLLGLRVIDTKGRKIRPIRAFFRTLAYFPSGLCFGMGFLWAAFDVERRAVHDLLTGTFVARGVPRPEAAEPERTGRKSTRSTAAATIA